MGRRSREGLYAITDQRCLIWQAMWRKVHFEEFAPADLVHMRSGAWRKDGAGDLVLRTEVRVSGKGQRMSTRKIEYGFIGIPDVAGVERLVRETLSIPS